RASTTSPWAARSRTGACEPSPPTPTLPAGSLSAGPARGSKETAVTKPAFDELKRTLVEPRRRRARLAAAPSRRRSYLEDPFTPEIQPAPEVGDEEVRAGRPLGRLPDDRAGAAGAESRLLAARVGSDRAGHAGAPPADQV